MKIITHLILITSLSLIQPCSKGDDQGRTEEIESLPIVRGSIPNQWLEKKVATKENILSTDLTGRFGWSEKCIRLLQAKAEPEDEIWYFDNHRLAQKMGRMGFALVRKGKSIAYVVTVMS